jgi:lambda family phage portal protein
VIGRALARLFGRREPAAPVSRRNYEGARLDRTVESWLGSGASADAAIAVAGQRLRDRARDLVRNNPHAARAVSAITHNIVGAGIMPRAASGDAALDRRVDQLFAAWARRCDADGIGDYYALQSLAVREMVEAGEIFVRRLVTTGGGAEVPLRLQLLEPEMLDPTVRAEGAEVVQGIELDAEGRRAAYWFRRRHPAGIFSWQSLGRDEAVRVPASDVAHLYERQRTQLRGVTWFAPVMIALRQLDDYAQAEIVRKKIESCVVAIVTTDDETQQGIAPTVVDADGNRVEKFEPGLITYARGGKDVKFTSPASAGGYTDYVRTCLHMIAAGLRLPYELLSGDLSQVNYSSIRAGLVEFRRWIETVQWQIVIPQFCEPTWAWFTEAAWAAGLIPTPEVPVEWSPPRFESVDPLKDAQADLLRVRSGIKTLREAIAEQGRNPDDVFEEIAATNAKLDALGLVVDSDPRKQTKSGALQQQQQPQEQADGYRP